MPVKYDNFTDRNELWRRWDKLSKSDKDMVQLKWQGCLSVCLNDPKLWAVLENYIQEYESQQPTLPLGLTEGLVQMVQKCEGQKLDKA